MRLKVTALPVFLLWTACMAQASPSGDMELYLETLHSYRADFSQTVVDAEGRTVEEARGQLSFRRPGRFRWDYREPFEQLIVADGERIWIYDADLEQVTVRPADDARSPMALLEGTEVLEEQFEILDEAAAYGFDWVRLKPYEPEGDDMVAIRVGLRDGALAVMVIEDAFGQVTTVELSNAIRNPALEDGLFRFEPPEGVDVIGAED